MKKIIEFFKKPRLYLYIPSFILLVGSLIIAFLNQTPRALALVCYGISFITLSYFVYGTVYYILYLKRNYKTFMQKREITKRFMEDYDFKSLITSIISFLITLGFAIFEAVLGIVYRSVWFGALAVYRIALLLARTTNLFLNIKYHLTKDESTAAKRIKLRMYFANGLFLIFISLAISLAVWHVVYRGESFKKPGEIIVIAYAAYVFFKMGLAIYHIVKSVKNQELNIIVIRNINLADAFLSMFALQTALFSAYSQDNENLVPMMNRLIGFGVCILVALLGIFMIIHSILIKRRRHQEIDI